MPRPDVPDVIHPRDVNGEPPAVLRLRVPIDQTLKTADSKEVTQMLASFAADRQKLLAAREQRAQPARDEKIVISLNGLTIAALAQDQPTGLLKHEVYRGQVQTSGFLQDYASLGAAFMSLADVTGEGIWRDRARLLANSILDRFVRADGAFSTASDEKDLLIPVADDGDAEAPSGTSMAIDLLLRLHETSAERRYLEAITRATTRLSGQFQDHPESWAASVATLNRHQLPLGSAGTTATIGPPQTNATDGI